MRSFEDASLFYEKISRSLHIANFSSLRGIVYLIKIAVKDCMNGIEKKP